MIRSRIVETLLEKKLVAVIRMDEDKAEETIESIISGGVSCIEITMTMSNALSLIEHFNEDHGKNQNVLIGAGTVIDVVSAKLAIQAGARFIVGPMFDRSIAELCNLYQVPYIPGVSNPQDVFEALKHGSDILKLFPASQFQTNIVKELQGPFPQAQFMISGKVSTSNIKSWFDQGASIVCLGSTLTNQGHEASSAAKEYLDIVESLNH